MNDEAIKKMSSDYAEYMCPVGDYCGGIYDDQRNSDLPIYKDDAKSVLEWLSERYCIVPKSVLRERHRESELQSISNSRIDMVSGASRIVLLESIFGKDMFEEEKE